MYNRARQKLVATRQALEEELIISGGEETLLTKARSAILEQKPMDLLENLKEGKVSAVAALEAFQAKVMNIFIFLSRTTISQGVQTRFPVQLAFAKFISRIKGNF